MEQQGFDIKRIRAQLYLDYGVNLDETSITILFVLAREQQKQFAAQNQKTDKAIAELQTAAQRINQSQRTLQVDTSHPRWQAFWFGMGKWGFALTLFIILLFIEVTIYSFNQQDNERLKQEWSWYKAYYESTQANKNKELKQIQNNHPKSKQAK